MKPACATLCVYIHMYIYGQSRAEKARLIHQHRALSQKDIYVYVYGQSRAEKARLMHQHRVLNQKDMYIWSEQG